MASSPLPVDFASFRRIILLIVLIIALSSAVEINADTDAGEVLVVEEKQQSQREFDFFLLSLLWPGTSCRNTTHCCSSNACCHGSKTLTEFTIHGLWSNYNNGTWPSCCTGKRFDLAEISRLSGVMNKYWPTYNCTSMPNCYGGEGSFWEHEWEKHGTCSARVTGDEYSYFITTLNLYFKYNVTEILREAGYVASNCQKYPLGGIISAIQNAFHATPEITCSGGAVDELRLCFYKDFKPRDCGIISGSRKIVNESSCPEYVSLPAYVYSNHASS